MISIYSSFMYFAINLFNIHYIAKWQHFEQLLDEVFVISRIIKVGVSVKASAENTYPDHDYSGYHITESNIQLFYYTLFRIK